MKSLLFIICLLPTMLIAQSEHRVATEEETKVLLTKEDEVKLKVMGTELNNKNERNLINQILIKQAIDNGKLETEQTKGYIQKLTNQGLDKSQITDEIENISKQYFEELQQRETAKIITVEKFNESVAKYHAILEKFDTGKLTNEELKKEFEIWDAIIPKPDKAVTAANKIKKEEFKKSFFEAQNKNTFVKSTPAIKGKDFTPFKIMVPNDFSLRDFKNEPLCLSDAEVPHDAQLSQLNNYMASITNEGQFKKPLFHQIYFAWGYNRGWHTNSDVKFTTPDGTFTIHDTKSNDRPSPFSVEDYFNPSNLSIPQYNMELGLMFNDKWGIEVKQDHMKMVFDNTRPYEITGDYGHKVVVTNPNPTNEWDGQIPVDFSVAKANKDATWLRWEHTDGYNYVSVGAVYNQNLYKTKNEKFKIDGRFGAGAGLMIPKTDVAIHQDQRWNYIGKNNEFHVAGGGVHGEAKLRFTFWNTVFLQAATRGTYIKVKDALVDGTSSRMEHIQMIGSVQVMGQIGYVHTFKHKKKKVLTK